MALTKRLDMYVLRDTAENRIYLPVAYDCLVLARRERDSLLKGYPEDSGWHERLGLFEEYNGKLEPVAGFEHSKCKNIKPCKFGCQGTIHKIHKNKKVMKRNAQITKSI